jgi:hypothetical protein
VVFLVNKLILSQSTPGQIYISEVGETLELPTLKQNGYKPMFQLFSNDGISEEKIEYDSET